MRIDLLDTEIDGADKHAHKYILRHQKKPAKYDQDIPRLTGTWSFLFRCWSLSPTTLLSSSATVPKDAILSWACFIEGALASKLAAFFITSPVAHHRRDALLTPVWILSRLIPPPKAFRNCSRTSAESKFWEIWRIIWPVLRFIDTHPSPSKKPWKYFKSVWLAFLLPAATCGKGSSNVLPSTANDSIRGQWTLRRRPFKRSHLLCHFPSSWDAKQHCWTHLCKPVEVPKQGAEPPCRNATNI